MLALELCKRLRDAGFPQFYNPLGFGLYYDLSRTHGDKPVCSLLIGSHHGPVQYDADEIACPNSDELLAEIRREFGEQTMADDWYELVFCALNNWYNDAYPLERPDRPGDLTEALAMYYLALKDQSK